MEYVDINIKVKENLFIFICKWLGEQARSYYIMKDCFDKDTQEFENKKKEANYIYSFKKKLEEKDSK